MRGQLTLGMGLFLAAALASGGTPHFEALRAAMESRQIGTVEALVAVLPEELRASYTLVFRSRSLQSASFVSPRAILYGNDAAFIVTFNGDLAARGYRSVETMEFDAQANRFVLREVTFAADGAAAGRTISEPNPARCVACHGAPARPIWDTPPSWPGIYGERYGAGLSRAEKAGIDAFLAQQPAHPRYRYLGAAARFAERATYVTSGRALYNGATVEPPNAELTTRLSVLNARSILSELVVQPGFAAHRFALLAAASAGCGSPAGYYPDAEQPQIRNDYQEFRELTSAASARDASAKAVRRTGHTTPSRSAGAALDLDALRFVTERSLGLPTDHWSLALERGAGGRSAPAGATTLEQGFFEMVAGADATLRRLATYRTYTATDGYCSYLRRQSQRALGAWYVSHPLAAATTPRAPTAAPPPARVALLGRCAGCHSSDVAPPIPFAASAELAGRLGSGNYPHGRLLDEILYRLAPEAGADRMPRGTALTESEQHELEDYFLSLAPTAASR